jgi:hypothetical protein
MLPSSAIAARLQIHQANQNAAGQQRGHQDRCGDSQKCKHALTLLFRLETTLIHPSEAPTVVESGAPRWS